jgi:chromosome segregation ATPase
MSKKDDQILELTVANDLLEKKLAAITSELSKCAVREGIFEQRIVQLEQESSTSSTKEKDYQQEIIRLVKERDQARSAAKDWRHFADAEKALRNRYKDFLARVMGTAFQVNSLLKLSRQYAEQAEKLTDETENLLRLV